MREAPDRRLRLLLLASVALLMPVSKVISVGGKETNLSLADPVLLLACFYLGYRFLRYGLRAPMLGLFVLNVATVVLSSLVNMDLTLLSRGPGSVVVECLKIVNLWLNVFVVVNCVESRRDLLVFLRFWIAGGTVVGLLGAMGSLAWQHAGMVTPFSLEFRATGTFEDPNLFAAHLSLCFFLTLLYRRLSGHRSFLTLLAAGLQLTGVVLSASRGGFLALTLGLFFLWLMESSPRTKVVSAAVAAGLILLVALAPNREKLLRSNPVTRRLATTTTDLSSPEAANRTVLWRNAIHQFLYSPLVGVGRGNLAVGAEDPGVEGEPYAHNVYLGLLGEVGIIGFLVYALVGIRVATLLARVRWGAFPGGTAGAAGLMLAALVTLGLCGMTINLENYRGLWMFLGVIESFRLFYLPDSMPAGAGERIAASGTDFHSATAATGGAG